MERGVRHSVESAAYYPRERGRLPRSLADTYPPIPRSVADTYPPISRSLAETYPPNPRTPEPFPSPAAARYAPAARWPDGGGEPPRQVRESFPRSRESFSPRANLASAAYSAQLAREADRERAGAGAGAGDDYEYKYEDGQWEDGGAVQNTAGDGEYEATEKRLYEEEGVPEYYAGEERGASIASKQDLSLYIHQLTLKDIRLRRKLSRSLMREIDG
jgi:hypothetical protein